MDYALCLIVGSLYIFSLTRTIVMSTLIMVDPLNLFFMGVLSMVLFFVILYNKVTRITAAAIWGLVALLFLFTLDDFSEQYPLL